MLLFQTFKLSKREIFLSVVQLFRAQYFKAFLYDNRVRVTFILILKYYWCYIRHDFLCLIVAFTVFATSLFIPKLSYWVSLKAILLLFFPVWFLHALMCRVIE